MLWWWTIAMLGLYALVAQTCSSATCLTLHATCTGCSVLLCRESLKTDTYHSYHLGLASSWPCTWLNAAVKLSESMGLANCGLLWVHSWALLCDDVVLLEFSKKFFEVCMTNLGNANLEWPWEMKHPFPEAKQYNIIARSSVALAAAVLCGFPYNCIIQIWKSSCVMIIGVEQGISLH